MSHRFNFGCKALVTTAAPLAFAIVLTIAAAAAANPATVFKAIIFKNNDFIIQLKTSFIYNKIVRFFWAFVAKIL
jgi:hypothetical protein